MPTMAQEITVITERGSLQIVEWKKKCEGPLISSVNMCVHMCVYVYRDAWENNHWNVNGSFSGGVIPKCPWR